MGLRRIAISQRDKFLALELPVFVKLSNPSGISADTDIAGFIERTACLPYGAAEPRNSRRDSWHQSASTPTESFRTAC